MISDLVLQAHELPLADVRVDSDGASDPVGWGPYAWRRSFRSYSNQDLSFINIDMIPLSPGKRPQDFVDAQIAGCARIQVPLAGDASGACDLGGYSLKYAAGYREVALNLTASYVSSTSAAAKILADVATAQIAVIQRAYDGKTPLHAVIPTPTPTPTARLAPTVTPTPTPTMNVLISEYFSGRFPAAWVANPGGGIDQSIGNPAPSWRTQGGNLYSQGFTWPGTFTLSFDLRAARDSYEPSVTVEVNPVGVMLLDGGRDRYSTWRGITGGDVQQSRNFPSDLAWHRYTLKVYANGNVEWYRDGFIQAAVTGHTYSGVLSLHLYAIDEAWFDNIKLTVP